MAKWYSIAASRNGTGSISILSDIGMGASDSVSASSFDRELKTLGRLSKLYITISSNGGDVSQGMAIFNMLSRHPARKIVTIDGTAASMASVIAMVGDEILMPANSMLMIHEPWGGVSGESDQIISFGEALSKMRDQIASIYSKRSGLSEETVLALMARESWLTAQEAVELGLADRVIEPNRMAAHVDTSRFEKAPDHLRDSNGRKNEKLPRRSLAEIATWAHKRWNSTGKPREADHDES